MVGTIAQLIGGIIVSAGVIPQITHILKTKKANDLSLFSLSMITGGILLMEIYAIELFRQHVGVAFFITNTISLFLQLSLVVIVAYFKKERLTIAKPRKSDF